MALLIYSQKHGRTSLAAFFSKLYRTVKHRDEYISPIPEAERHDLILAYHAQLNSVDNETRIRAAKAWAKWE